VYRLFETKCFSVSVALNAEIALVSVLDLNNLLQVIVRINFAWASLNKLLPLLNSQVLIDSRINLDNWILEHDAG
jgi:hypothetical protein